ncbi:tagaturonate reductase [Portibacter marinus]|uniref:tagaturonate reductase n=1 Tax=Portibacter marinus TaxID=2898660 RepID=UPI001F2DFA5F|nr:tagaturonate reductase [Portibacter marinus]
MKTLNRESSNLNRVYPERVLQFGGGNFLRGFVDWIIDKYNRQSNDEKMGVLVAKVQKQGSYQDWKNQDGLFHLFTKGYINGRTVDEKTLVTCVSRILEVHQEYEAFLCSSQQSALNIVVSNATEAGLEFDPNDSENDVPFTFPGQLCRWLEARWMYFGSDRAGKCIILPCELVKENGEILKNTVLRYAKKFGIKPGFKNWLNTHCTFCNTLVDRIVPGISKSEFPIYQERSGYCDLWMTKAEPYHLWVVETDYDLSAQLPLDRIGLNVIYTKDLTPYRERKVKILNGAHTAMVPIGLCLEIPLVKEVVDHEDLGPFIEKMVFEEIIPCLNLDQDKSKKYAEEVFDRFRNPYLDHYLRDIALYSISKFNHRLKPSIKAFTEKYHRLPKRCILAFACLLIFYKGRLKDIVFETNDKADQEEAMTQHWIKMGNSGVISPITLQALLSDGLLWEEDLTIITGFTDLVSEYLSAILNGKLSLLIQELNDD